MERTWRRGSSTRPPRWDRRGRESHGHGRRGARGEPDARADVLGGNADRALGLPGIAVAGGGAARRARRPDADVEALFAEAQAAKAFVNEAAARVVDRALALSGGAGYLNGSPLARAYRDVKAGAFMHPLGANRAYEFLADISLGGCPCCTRRSGRSGYTSSIVVSATNGACAAASMASAPPARRSSTAVTPQIWRPASCTASIALISGRPS